MSDEQNINTPGPADNKAPVVSTGNASNPAPDDDSLYPSPGNQLLNERAEKYLREVASIEDMPDALDQKEMDEILKKEEEK
jgi:hypothetical protein